VWTRTVGGEVRERFDELLVDGQIAVCDMVRLELLYSARNAKEFSSLRDDLAVLQACPIGAREWARALEVYGALADEGGLHHRSVKHPDLLIAAAAESAGLAVVHYDEDFDRIANVTGQPVRWLAPRGSL
jgi:predicted nucleic acid-binding protein